MYITAGAIVLRSIRDGGSTPCSYHTNPRSFCTTSPYATSHNHIASHMETEGMPLDIGQFIGAAGTVNELWDLAAPPSP